MSGIFDREMRSHRVGELGVVLDLLNHADNFRRYLLVQLHIILELVDDRARQRFGLDLLAARIREHDGVGLVVLRAVGVALDLGARSALHQHLDGAVGQLEQLQHTRQRPDLEDGTRRRVIVGRILLGREQDEGIGTHHLFERLDRLFASNEKRDDHVREDDNVAQRQYRISAGFAGDQRRLWLCASHGPRSLLLCPPPVTRGCGITVECRGGPGREHGRPRWAPVRQRVGTKPSPENFEAILRTLFRSHNRWRRLGLVSSKPENSSK